MIFNFNVVGGFLTFREKLDFYFGEDRPDTIGSCDIRCSEGSSKVRAGGRLYRPGRTLLVAGWTCLQSKRIFGNETKYNFEISRI